MTPTWQSDDVPTLNPISASGWLRAVLRGVPLVALIFGGLVVLLLLRLIERPVFKEQRPWTPFITQTVCRGALRILGLKRKVIGTPLSGAGAIVANHSSWLDIFVLNATKRIYFVSKAEVANWPGIGWLARATGTVFIKRNRQEAASQVEVFRQRLAAGHRLLFFPEGTSTDGQRVLAFKTTLFAAFFDESFRETLQLQAVSIRYQPDNSLDPRFYGWWGDMDLVPHLLQLLSSPLKGRVTLEYHPPINIADAANRKELAKSLEDQTRSGFD